MNPEPWTAEPAAATPGRPGPGVVVRDGGGPGSGGRRWVMTIAGINLSEMAFWGLPLADRAAAFAMLRAQDRPVFYPEPEVPFTEKGPGFYALVRHADVAE